MSEAYSPYNYTVPKAEDTKYKTDADTNGPKWTDRQWWRCGEKDNCKPHEILDKIVQELENDQSGRYDAYKEYERLFGASETAYGDDSFRAIATDELTQNELANVIETLWSQVFKDKILPAISVSEGDWDAWDRARGLQRWLLGLFEESGLYTDVIPQAGAYMFIHGSGGVKVGWKEVGNKQAKITFKARSPRFCGVDRLEARQGKPRSYYEKEPLDRWSLYEVYKANSKDFYGTPEERCKGIEGCTDTDGDLGPQQAAKSDMLTVREAWHLPSGPDAKDGCHCIWVRGCTLVYEKFGWDEFPTSWMRFGIRLNGFWGESAVRRLAPMQKNLDKLTQKIDEAQDVMGVPRIILGRQGNGLKLEHLDDIPGGILTCDDIGQIKDWNAQCATPELYRDRDSLPTKMRGSLGVSDFEVQQQIPQSMRDVSGAMLDRWVDQGKTRNAPAHNQYEYLIPKLAYLAVRQAMDLVKEGYDVIVKAPSDGSVKTSIQRLSFKDVMLDLDQMKIEVQSMSGMSDSFAGKVDAIEKMRNAGVNPRLIQSAERQLEIPDPNASRDMFAPAEEIIFKNLCWMTKNKKYIQPLQFDNLDLITRMTTDYINWYRIREDANSDVVGLLTQYIEDALRLKNGLGGNNPAAPPPMGAPPGGPMAGPMGSMAPGMAAPGNGPMPPPGASPGPVGPGQPPIPQVGMPAGVLPPGVPGAPMPVHTGM